MNIQENKKQKIFVWIWIMCLVAFVLLTRFYRLGDLPEKMHIDEVSVAVNAYNIAYYGTDASGNSWPVYFLNFNGGQSAAYTYLLALCIKLFGLSAWTIRLPSAVCGVLFIWIGMRLLQELLVGKHISLSGKPFSKLGVGLVGASLMAIMPYFIHISRLGMDCNLMMPAVTLSLLITVRAVKQKRTGLWILAGICWGLSLYTYALSYLMIPLFFVLFFLYLIRCHQFKFKNAVLMLLPVIVIAWPLMVYVAVGTFGLNMTHIGVFSLPKMFVWRGSEFTVANVLDNFQRMFLGLLGIEATGTNTIVGIGVFYPFSVLLYLLGMEEIVRKEIRYRKAPVFRVETVLLLQNISVWLVGLFLDNMDSIGRINGKMFSVFSIAVYGGYRACKLLVPFVKKRSSSIMAISSVCIILLGHFGLFWVQYEKQFTQEERAYFYGYCATDLQQAVDLNAETPVYWDMYSLRDWKYFEVCFELSADEFNEQGFVRQTEEGQDQRNLQYDPDRWVWRNVRFGISYTEARTQAATFVVFPQHTDLIQILDARKDLQRVYDKDYLVYKPVNLQLRGEGGASDADLR